MLERMPVLPAVGFAGAQESPPRAAKSARLEKGKPSAPSKQRATSARAGVLSWAGKERSTDGNESDRPEGRNQEDSAEASDEQSGRCTPRAEGPPRRPQEESGEPNPRSGKGTGQEAQRTLQAGRGHSHGEDDGAGGGSDDTRAVLLPPADLTNGANPARSLGPSRSR